MRSYQIAVDIINFMLRRTGKLAATGAAALCVLAQESLLPPVDLPPETLLLARIKTRMAENLDRLPNYTCLQTIERSRRRKPSRRFELVDTLRLEVAVVGGKELFSWPGEKSFQDRELIDMIPGGTIGNGSFALHARAVFLSNAAVFTHQGERIRDARRTIRYDYHVSRLRSGYSIRVGEAKGIAAYQGSFWVDPETLDLIRLEVYANEIPPQLPISEATDFIEYERVRIGDGDFLLPKSAELTMVDLPGNENRNRTTFSGCRQYSGESVISFGEAPGSAAPPVNGPVVDAAAIALPAGLELNLQLENTIEFARSAVGDSVTAKVADDVRRQGKVIVPKAARVSGRITRLERVTGVGRYLIGLRFSSIEFDGRRGDTDGELLWISALLPPRATRLSGHANIIETAGDRLRQGLHMRWRITRREEP